MFEVNIQTNRGTQVGRYLWDNTNACVLGKDKNCSVVLHGWKVNKRHAEIYSNQHGLYIRDLNGGATFVNGHKVTEYGPLNNDDEIAIHSYRITVLQADSDTKTSTLDTNSNKQTQVMRAPRDNTPLLAPIERAKAPSSQFTAMNVNNKLAIHWQVKLHENLLNKMDLRRVNVNTMTDNALTSLTQQLLDEILSELTDFPESLNKQDIIQRVLSEAVGLGPLEKLLSQENISEIMVNAADEIFYEQEGRIYKSDIVFSHERAVLFAIERIVAPLGRRIDESSPMVDARLKDGSRVNAVIPPLALKGPTITIRKFMKEKLNEDHLVKFGSASSAMMAFLQTAVTYKQNLVISGGTGSGKTTLLNILSNFIPDHERIISIEDSAELRLYQPNLVSLEARPANQEGKGAIAIRDLVTNCLRMRPDRIVVGECRGGEALDMLQAMNTGHDGSLTTIHANTPHDCISRIEVMVMMAGMDLPSSAIREQVASAVNIIVQQTRYACGSRKISNISEVTGIDSNRVQIGTLFKFEQEGYDSEGKVKGRYVATGQIPRFYETMRDRGISVDLCPFEVAG